MSPGTQAAVALVIALVVVVLVARAVGRSRVGRRIGGRVVRNGDVVVQCRSGHLFTTVWIPGMSFKAIRLGLVRFQYCPGGDHWSFVTPVIDPTDTQRRIAAANHDARIP
ncbi:MAG: hypothetical protein ACRDV3_06875 [Acidothermaceae bacterium]